MMEGLKQIRSFIDNHPLAGKHQLKAYTKFAFWQLSQLLYPHETIVTFVGKTKLIATKGLTGATGNIYAGLHEFEDMGFLLHFLRPGDLFADIGANIGSYTVLASGYVGSRTLSFEPVPSTFNWLQKNIRINQIQDNVKAFNMGLGSGKQKLHFTSSFDTINHVVEKYNYNNESIVEVEVEALDAIAQIEGRPSLLKIDVEGYETEVIKGMTKTLQSSELKAIIIELNGSGIRYGYDESWIHKELSYYGFAPYRYKPFERQLMPLKRFENQNTIYIRGKDYVEQRLRTAKKVHIFSEEF